MRADMKITKNSINGKPFRGTWTVVKPHVQEDYACLYDYCEGFESYVEIGTAHGRSACVAGFAITGDVHCIDPFMWTKGWLNFGVPEEVIRQNWKNMGHDPERLHIYRHATPPLPLALTISGVFDVGLIDGKHGPFDHVMGDFDALSPHITKYLLIHDIHTTGNRKHIAPREVFDWVVEHNPDWEKETVRGCMGVLKRV